mmetsp:Transcript_14500/g.21326  ORF Transcript_14500/g.21326 Transcript_14500/m.21326 type:complete len:179 (-) Transcript_14500:368-904(-)|eukprot:CAMPEP_0194046996 /NCGR_PEP_ID=MMETSP0009_2-20130614/23321_1 /TAXON_ID=210454 /ORGANISM="Grammatophora oceanica, Strain CCMP 410" /LENGTH=178 /DNA_ID=CAMNT_0038692491 /DNA_START=109 /DNA_END=645 /DNA_ORIENTATION=+
MKIAVFFLALVSAVSAFQVSQEPSSRRAFLQQVVGGAATAVVATATGLVAPASAAEIVVPEQSTDYEFPSDWGLTFNYEQDASKVRTHMIIATGLAKGAEKMEDFGKNLKKEMTDFVSYYRRFPKVAGKPSFSTLYTSINVLAGHYTSYGFKYPLPEKRRKRLYQEYAEIEKSLKRSR